MDIQQLFAFITFAFASTVSPGPNNIMLMTSGAHVGFKRTIPHMLGITFGFSFMVVLVGLGLMGIFHQYPVSQDILQVLCLAYLAYLAFKIAISPPVSTEHSSYKPMSFFAAANFQWVNPKAWSMAITAIGVYNVSGSWQGMAIISLGFAMVNLPSVSIWTVAGQKMQRVLSQPNIARTFNYIMAGLLLGSAALML